MEPETVRIRAPELAPYTAWINSDRPLSIRELRGQVVVLDFWTYCCVNCMHVLPILRSLEEHYAEQPFVVLGVHSAKFETEGRPERIEDAVHRYGIKHPVVVDHEFGIWHAYAVRSWPTLVVIRPDGTLAAVAPGEPDEELLHAFLEEVFAQARKDGSLAHKRFHHTQHTRTEQTALSFPGKIAVAPDGRIAISDSGHHRVLVTDATGHVQHTIGTGLRGFRDGSFSEAAFDDPQGVCWDGEALWICDARNHALRRAVLGKNEVQTIAGTGRMGTTVMTSGGPGRQLELRSPWDVVVKDGKVLVAMAGAHQLWSFHPVTGEAEPWAGTGREALVDGPRTQAAFAQPSGLALSGLELLVADSETSALRSVNFSTGMVQTLVGSGLFDYGHNDGALSIAMMQHPLAVAAKIDGSIVVADTYNDRLRRIDPQRTQLETFYVGENETALREPAGIALRPDGGWLVADTNHHRIVRISANGVFEGTLSLEGVPEAQQGVLPSSATQKAFAASNASWFNTALKPVAGIHLGEGEGTLSLTIGTPEGWKFAAGSALTLALEVSRRSDLLDFTETTVRTIAQVDDPVVLALRAHVATLPAETISSEVLVRIDAVLCRDHEGGVCAPVKGFYRLPIELSKRGNEVLGYRLPLLRPPLDE